HLRNLSEMFLSGMGWEERDGVDDERAQGSNAGDVGALSASDQEAARAVAGRICGADRLPPVVRRWVIAWAQRACAQSERAQAISTAPTQSNLRRSGSGGTEAGVGHHGLYLRQAFGTGVARD